MIFVDGVPISSTASSSSQEGTATALVSLMAHRDLVSASDNFKSSPERKISNSEGVVVDGPKPRKYVYIFQREYATVDPALVDQRHGTRSASHGKMDGFSFPLCSKIIETLQKNHRKFTIRTLFILHHNTRSDPDGNTRPVFNGFVVETKSGSIVPASFCRSMRCPDNIVRGIRVSASYEDPNWEGKLLETYDTRSDRFVIASCIWTSQLVKFSMILQDLPDSEILRTCSTSPSAEGPDFVETLRRQWEYLIRNPDWRGTFPNKKSRVFKRSSDGSWVRCEE